MDELLTDRIVIIKQDGREFSDVRASVQKNKIFVGDGGLPIEEGDVVRRVLPSGIVEEFVIEDRGFYGGVGSIDAHFQMKVRRVPAPASRSAMQPRVEKPTGGALQLPSEFESFKRDVARFHQDEPFERSVFVMMKFPDPITMDSDRTRLLKDIYATIRDELDAHGLFARRADDQTYASSNQLWDNVCVYMLGCKYGVAVLEDKVAQELNPNIALEYGFMRGLGRSVALLREEKFKHTRVDLVGTIAESFKISDLELDESSLRKAVSGWLVGKAARRRRT